MNGSQRAVLWIGLLLIVFNLVRKRSEISSVIFSGSSGSPGGSPPSSSGSSGGHVTVPIDPFLPTGPKITIPIPTLSKTTAPTTPTKLVINSGHYNSQS